MFLTVTVTVTVINPKIIHIENENRNYCKAFIAIDITDSKHTNTIKEDE